MNPLPTVGRVVLYRRIDDGIPVPAIVAEAGDPDRLTLFIMDPHPNPYTEKGQAAGHLQTGFFQKGVLYDRETSTPGRWSWPSRV